MEVQKTEVIERATVSDIDQIMTLYRLVYGKKYPIKYGTDAELLKHSILNRDTHLVTVTRIVEDNIITGALITEIDTDNKIGKLVGLVVHPDFQKNKTGHRMVVYVSDYFLEKDERLNSLYATTRTNNVGPQRVFIKNNYLPMGIFPNSHRLSQYETVTLFAKYRKNVLEKRKAPTEVSASLIPMYQILKGLVPKLEIPQVTESGIGEMAHAEEAWEFEIIRAPNYVYRKFLEQFPEAKDRFFPFHFPNIIIADKKGRIEIFAYFSKRDGYCTLIKSTADLTVLAGSLTSLYMILDDIGVSYIEVLVDVSRIAVIETLLAGQFAPSAIYPAMREVNDELKDYIVLSRTMEPLNFRGMAVISQFKPYVDLYVDTWKQVNLESIEVIYGPK